MSASKTIGIAGLGLLGRGIAACFLSRGLRVVGYDNSENARAVARLEIERAIDELVTRGGEPESLRTEWPKNYVEAKSFADFAQCDFVLESVIENEATKRQVFEQIEAVVRPAIPIATNTSALPITLLASKLKHPERFIGMHWCPPCHITRFMEIIRGEKTNDATADVTMQLARIAGKDPALVEKDVAGFIVNRMHYAIYREAIYLLESGVGDVATIDRAFQHVIGLYATIAGPFRWMDLTGLPAYAAVMERLFPKLANTTEVPETMKKLMADGAKGATSGHGFYDYTPEEAKRWQALLEENVWRVRETLNDLFPEKRDD
ncbi:MAG TPA: 3-hydroxyacyl-CoA dehydrogenase NAD-binding domain-containing protein [Tepidisphaeraceae bacterium]|jgi:3-hydroxybutyryl-CoA dehydrogenase|nr:3-hydroxyacyl-CoA dehydrogenase NAD-binding domain-containing protein [Tepidisphaeraceae bacterium]